MGAMDRYSALSMACSVEEVVRVTRDYLASWSREEFMRLPDGCRPAPVRDPQDIEHWADRLAGQAARVDLFAEDEGRLDKLASHFLIASVRISALRRSGT